MKRQGASKIHLVPRRFHRRTVMRDYRSGINGSLKMARDTNFLSSRPRPTDAPSRLPHTPRNDSRHLRGGRLRTFLIGAANHSGPSLRVEICLDNGEVERACPV